MSKRNNKSSGTAGLVGLLGVALGAGLGYLATKLFQSESQNKKQQIKVQVPIMKAKQQTCQITKTSIDNYDDLQELMICPITHEIMTQPCVLTSCGHSFERKFIYDWVQKKGSCPLCVTNACTTDIQVNYQLKELIHYNQKNKNNPKKETQKEAQK